MRKSDIQDEIMNKIQRKIDKDIERMKSKKDMDKSVEKQIRKQLLDLYLFQNTNESQKNLKLVDRLNKRANEILEQNERELIINIRNKMSNIEQELEKLDFKFIRYNDTLYGHCNVVYCYLNKKTELIDYIGSTGGLHNRIQSRNSVSAKKVKFDIYYREHKSDYELYLLRLCKTREEAYKYERKFIELIKPKFNIQYNPDNPLNQQNKQLVNANDYYDLNQWKQLSYEMRKKHEICQLCGKNKSTEVHHIFPFMHQFEDVREEVFLDKDNLICLCTDCHHQVHAKNYGNLGIPERMKIEKLRNHISQKYLNQGKILSWL